MILSGGTTTLGVYDFKASLDKEASHNSSYPDPSWSLTLRNYHPE